MEPPANLPADGDTVALSVPADSSYLGLVRTTTATLGARLDLTIDDIEDLRLAVNEAAAMLLLVAESETALHVVFTVRATTLTIRLEATTGSAPLPDTAGFGWLVLSELAGAVTAASNDGLTHIELSHSRRSALT